MHIVIGKLGAWNTYESDHSVTALQKIYGPKCYRTVSNRVGFAHVLSDNNSLLYGITQDEGVIVLFYGVAHHPVRDWKFRQMPQDNPRLVAEHLLSCYRKYGIEVTSCLTGTFSCCILDEKLMKGLLFIDAGGMRNLYRTEEKNGGAWFGTNPRALVRCMPEKGTVDRSLEDFFLCYGFYPFHRTMYKGVTSISSDSLVEFKNGFFNVGLRAKPVSVGIPDIEAATEEQAVNILYDIFMRAMADQCTSEARVGVLLGGVDSALVASALRRLGKEVETFSFQFENKRFNQPYTETLAKAIGSRHYWIPIRSEVVANGHKNFAEVFCQPTNWASYPIQTAYVCERIKKKDISFVYSGDGCDGVFMGYPNVHKRSYIYNKVKKLPDAANNALHSMLSIEPLEFLLGRIYTIISNVVRSLNRSGAERLLLTFKVMEEKSLPKLRKGPQPLQEKDIETIISELASPLVGLSPDRISYAGKSLVSPNKNKMNGCMDQHGIVLLSPYLHPILKEFAQKIPDRLLRPRNATCVKASIGKYLLLKMIEHFGLLPREIVYQPKLAAVDGPIDNWYAKNLSLTMRSILSGLPFMIDQRYLRFLFTDHLLDKLYKHYFSSDEVASHAISLLATYASYTKGMTTN